MNKVKLNEIDLESSFFHFTNALNIELISKYGLLPTIGESSKGLESTEKIFFAEGTDGVLKICDVWIKLIMNKMNNYFGLLNRYEGSELHKMSHEWDKEFISREYLKDGAKKIKAFERMFDDMIERRYLILHLKEGTDFSYNDIDEAKDYSLQNKAKDSKNRNYQYIKELYGNYSNVDVATVERWNMHTFTGLNILPNQISELTTADGRKNAMSILLEIYDKHKSINVRFDMLDEFIEYSKERIKDEKNRENFETETYPEKATEILKRNGLHSLVKKLGEETLEEQESTVDKDKVQDEIRRQENINNRDGKTQL